MDPVSEAKESFISGLLMLLPLIITLLIIKFLTDYVFMLVNPIVKSTNLTQYTANIEIIAQGIAVVLVVSVITGLGYLSSYRGTERFRRKFVHMMEEVPVFGSVYSTVSQISSSFTGENSKFKEIVLVEFPRKGIYSLGLVTSNAPESAEEASEEGEMKSVYIPYSPNPTMGNLIMIPEDRYSELDMSIQKGMKLLLTTGIAYEEEELPEELRGATGNT